MNEVIDVEEFFKSGKPVPVAAQYRFRVGKTSVTVDSPTLLGRDILSLAGKVPPEKYLLQQLGHGGATPVALDQFVDLRAPGIERFSAIPKEVTDGE